MHEEIVLTESQMDLIAERAAERALEKVYADVGKTVLRRLAWLAGLVVVSAMMWLAGKDALQP